MHIHIVSVAMANETVMYNDEEADQLTNQLTKTLTVQVV